MAALRLANRYVAGSLVAALDHVFSRPKRTARANFRRFGLYVLRREPTWGNARQHGFRQHDWQAGVGAGPDREHRSMVGLVCHYSRVGMVGGAQECDCFVKLVTYGSNRSNPDRDGGCNEGASGGQA